MLYFALYSLSEYVWSTLMGSTLTPRPRNWSWWSRISHSSIVHVPENASGKNASSTGRPRSAERVTFSPDVDGKLKSGACWPTAGTLCDSSAVIVDLSLRRERNDETYSAKRSAGVRGGVGGISRRIRRMPERRDQ